MFNKFYLDLDVEDVLRELQVEVPLQPPIEGVTSAFNLGVRVYRYFTESIAATPPFRPFQVASSYLRTARTHHEHISHFVISLHCQLEAIRIASRSLDLNVLAIVDTFEGVASHARGELEKQAGLLAGLQGDLDLISRVKIHTEFVSPAVRKAIEAGDRHRTLGDYVSNVKMKQVAETCSRTHGLLAFLLCCAYFDVHLRGSSVSVHPN